MSAVLDALKLPQGRLRTFLLLALSAFFVGAGANHFRDPDFYRVMMPPYLPAHGLLIAASGVLEILGGIAVLVPRVRRWAGLGLAGLLVAVLPANVHLALNPELFPQLPAFALVARLPLQLVLIAWAVWATSEEPTGD